MGKTTAPAGAVIDVDSPQNLYSLAVVDAYTLNNSALTLQSGSLSAGAALSTPAIINSDIILGANATFANSVGLHMALSKVTGVISDGGNGYSLTKTGIRNMDLTANNTYGGPTISDSGGAGTLHLRGTNETSGFICNSG